VWGLLRAEHIRGGDDRRFGVGRWSNIFALACVVIACLLRYNLCIFHAWVTTEFVVQPLQFALLLLPLGALLSLGALVWLREQLLDGDNGDRFSRRYDVILTWLSG
jgi:hypothetical protein